MPAPLNWQTVAAQVIYNAYPNCDLLPIDPPLAEETIGEFKVRAEEAGDTLFLFLCREADDEIDAHEYVRRLDCALCDIVQVRQAFVALSAHGELNASAPGCSGQ